MEQQEATDGPGVEQATMPEIRNAELVRKRVVAVTKQRLRLLIAAPVVRSVGRIALATMVTSCAVRVQPRTDVQVATAKM